MGSDQAPRPVPGQLVQVLRGKETGSFFVIVKLIDDRYVEIADGNRRKFDHAKKKNISHLDLQSYVSVEVQKSLQETGRVTNGKLRFAIAHYLDGRLSNNRKGESADG
ncbi:KOW domain-containing RNA-binding protein [Sporolactobacillus sp. THM19-2]|jgi:ribosomal protein L14E/L6E/L27E|uniref:KOW domain-containing RNA-binding protein n=1 Tax=Sporolactobacillus sp. THM19-2 TaxID=2511171 RepID=UPI0010209F47|nr:KOW domain-containing RNA-binding protein [Sporolactobacillus sp. THM19-2]RYL89400.1 RNA-binding protein [Sporolactobacillus sp. THM19-2]